MLFISSEFSAQPVIITCSKLTIETVEQGVTYFTPCPSVSTVNFEQVNAGWMSAR